jgi:hypothetical protein|tara:strand:+ start:416 stop:1150 length:735 start_codon:yes stop_codon:yes gene_type:complete
MQYDLINLGGGASTAINFPSPSDKKKWKKLKRHKPENWKYATLLQAPIKFTHNSLGYRTHEYDFDNDSDYIIHIGCSNTYGLYLHEHERVSNLIEQNIDIKTYNLGLCGGSPNYIMMNVANLLYNVSKKPTAVVIQWPNFMRLNFPSTYPLSSIMRIRPTEKQKGFGSFIQDNINPLETHSKWCRQHTLNLLNSFNVNTIEYTLNQEDTLTDITEIKRIDEAYDDKHIGALTNVKIFKYIEKNL